MAHEIDFSTGRAGFAERRSGGERAWHGLGQVIQDGDTLEVIAEKAGLNWGVLQAPDFFRDRDGAEHLTGKVVNYRSDTRAALEVVSDQYHVVQPAQVLEFFRDFMATNKMQMETAGALRGGRIVWALATLGKDFDFILPGNDRVRSYWRMQTSFDRSLATSGCATTIRQVCANTMRMIEHANAKGMYKTSHSIEFDGEGLKKAAGFLGEQHKITAQLYNELVQRRVDAAEQKKFFCELMGVLPSDMDRFKDGKPVVSTRTKNMIAELEQSFRRGPGADMQSANGTAFGLLQAATWWVDHAAGAIAKGGETKQSARLANSWYGRGEAMKQDAQRMAAELAGCAELLDGKRVAIAA